MKHIQLFCIFAILAFSFVQCKDSRGQILLDSTTVDTTTILSGLDTPWELIWGPDSFLWMTDRTGIVSRIHPNTGQQFVILDYTAQVTQTSESGMLGMVLHPDFANNPEVFIVYTYQAGSNFYERLVRFDYNFTNDTLINEVVLIDSIIANTFHDGSRLVFLSDTTLLMSTGDAGNAALSQNLNSLNGKWLRINPDGTIPSNNPIAGSLIYSWGHRNPQGIYIAGDGTIYSSEHGPSNDDELNIIIPGRNFGWPNVEGFCNTPQEINYCQDSNIVEPIFAWTPTIAVSDLVIYNHNAIPEWQGKILLTTLKEHDIRVITLTANGDSVTGVQTRFNNLWERLRAICVAPDGAVYIATNDFTPNHAEIIKIYNPNPPIKTEDTKGGMGFKMYPNPANNAIKVEAGDWCSKLQILDMTGRLVLTKNKFINNGILDISHLKSGIYILKASGSNQMQSKKLVVW